MELNFSVNIDQIIPQYRVTYHT